LESAPALARVAGGPPRRDVFRRFLDSGDVGADGFRATSEIPAAKQLVQIDGFALSVILCLEAIWLAKESSSRRPQFQHSAISGCLYHRSPLPLVKKARRPIQKGTYRTARRRTELRRRLGLPGMPDIIHFGLCFAFPSSAAPPCNWKISTSRRGLPPKRASKLVFLVSAAKAFLAAAVLWGNAFHRQTRAGSRGRHTKHYDQ